MVRKFKKKTLFFAGIVGLSLLSLFGMRGGSHGDSFTENDLKNLLAHTPKAHADVLSDGGPGPFTGDGACPSAADCPSGPAPGGAAP